MLLALLYASAKAYGFTIISISISLVAVFIPLFFMSGPIGLLFREFAVVVSLSILVSAIVSLTVIPMLCSRFLPKPGDHGKEYKVTKQFDRIFDWTLKVYVHYLDLALKNRKIVLWGAISTFFIALVPFVNSPKGFFPEEDIGQITATTEAAEDTSFKAMLELQDKAAEIINNDPNVATSISILGGCQSAGRNTGRFFIILKPKGDREKMSKVIEGLRNKFREIPDLQVYMRPVQNLQLGGRNSKSRYQFILQSVGFEGVNEWADKIAQKMRADPIFRDVTSDSQLKGLNVKIEINRDQAALAGVSIADIRTALYNSFGERQVSTIYTPVNTYYVILETAEGDRQYETDLNKVSVRGRATDKLIPLSSLAKFVRTVGPTAVNHQGQIPAVTISFNLAPDVFLGDATKAIDAFEKEIDLPPSIITSYGGDAAVFKDNQSGQVILILAALGVIYILLGCLYESYIHPLTILAGLPSAAIGAIVALRIFGFELIVIASIGILLLIGIVKKNAILMIDFALDAQRTKGLSPDHAIREACILRFRPIMMTTFTALMGALPIAFGLGAGAELRQPLGISVADGLIFPQFVTLIITPVIYLYLDKYAGNSPMEIPPSVLEGT
nr:efflux RND transporter permease subunit [Polynucleobacter necessarius]